MGFNSGFKGLSCSAEFWLGDIAEEMRTHVMALFVLRWLYFETLTGNIIVPKRDVPFGVLSHI